jgi:hypothetical protein
MHSQIACKRRIILLHMYIDEFNTRKARKALVICGLLVTARQTTHTAPVPMLIVYFQRASKLTLNYE